MFTVVVLNTTPPLSSLLTPASAGSPKWDHAFLNLSACKECRETSKSNKNLPPCDISSCSWLGFLSPPPPPPRFTSVCDDLKCCKHVVVSFSSTDSLFPSLPALTCMYRSRASLLSLLQRLHPPADKSPALGRAAVQRPSVPHSSELCDTSTRQQQQHTHQGKPCLDSWCLAQRELLMCSSARPPTFIFWVQSRAPQARPGSQFVFLSWWKRVENMSIFSFSRVFWFFFGAMHRKIFGMWFTGSQRGSTESHCFISSLHRSHCCELCRSKRQNSTALRMKPRCGILFELNNQLMEGNFLVCVWGRKGFSVEVIVVSTSPLKYEGEPEWNQFQTFWQHIGSEKWVRDGKFGLSGNFSFRIFHLEHADVTFSASLTSQHELIRSNPSAHLPGNVRESLLHTHRGFITRFLHLFNWKCVLIAAIFTSLQKSMRADLLWCK